MLFKNCCVAKRMFCINLMNHFKGFGNTFTELHTKLDADRLLDFAVHCRQNETQS
jgi:hypothetical protein